MMSESTFGELLKPLFGPFQGEVQVEKHALPKVHLLEE
jgi:hypothetical protein